MEEILTLIKEEGDIESIQFEDLDEDNDMMVYIDYKLQDRDTVSFYLGEDEIRRLGSHIEKVINKLNSK